MHIPMSSPDIGEADITATTAVLRTPYLSTGLRIGQGAVSPALPFSGVMIEAYLDQVCDTPRRVLRSGTGATHDTITHTSTIGAGS
jgi:hypothetical protein